MDFIKKNWGLIGYGIICLGVAGFLGWKVKAAGSLAGENADKVAEQKTFFEQLSGPKLDRSNVEIAEENQQVVQAKFKELRKALAERYQVSTGPVPTSVECMNMLQSELRRMNEELAAKGISVAQAAEFFSFEMIASSEKLPPEESVPEILRQLAIVREVVRLVSMGVEPVADPLDLEAPVMEIASLIRPLELSPLEEDMRRITPVEFEIVAPVPMMQDIINRFHTESSYLFFLRNVSFLSEDQAPEGGLAGAAKDLLDVDGGGAGMGGLMGGMRGMDEGGEEEMMGGRMMGGSGMRMGAGMMRGEYGEDNEGGMGMGPGMMGYDGMEGEDGAMMGQLPMDRLKRADLRVFEERVVSATLRFDLVEFVEPEAEEVQESTSFGLP